MLNNIVDNLEQCGQQNIVHGCFHQARTGCSFFAVYWGVRAKRKDRGCLVTRILHVMYISKTLGRGSYYIITVL